METNQAQPRPLRPFSKVLRHYRLRDGSSTPHTHTYFGNGRIKKLSIPYEELEYAYASYNNYLCIISKTTLSNGTGLNCLTERTTGVFMRHMIAAFNLVLSAAFPGKDAAPVVACRMVYKCHLYFPGIFSTVAQSKAVCQKVVERLAGRYPWIVPLKLPQRRHDIPPGDLDAESNAILYQVVTLPQLMTATIIVPPGATNHTSTGLIDTTRRQYSSSAARPIEILKRPISNDATTPTQVTKRPSLNRECSEDGEDAFEQSMHCWKCTNTYEKLPSASGELIQAFKHSTPNYHLKLSLYKQSHDVVAAFIFNILKDSFAASLVRKDDFNWYYYNRRKNRWMQRERALLTIMSEDGPIQESYRQYIREIELRHVEQDENVEKTKELWVKLESKLQKY
ncbi:hypothetical protein HDU78_005249 [Chytriomyces hyalinus]|nr:hypothetical protein HDU78_005249 [Chytriomyces hyalinus]